MNKHIGRVLEEVCIKLERHLRTPSQEIHRQLKSMKDRAIAAGIDIEHHSFRQVQRKLKKYEREKNGN